MRPGPCFTRTVLSDEFDDDHGDLLGGTAFDTAAPECIDDSALAYGQITKLRCRAMVDNGYRPRPPKGQYLIRSDGHHKAGKRLRAGA